MTRAPERTADNERAAPSPLETVSRFVGALNSNDLDGALDLLDPEVVYHNIPMTPVQGRDAVRQALQGFGIGGRLRADWRMLNIAWRDRTVLTERVDGFRTEDGRSMALPVMGVFEISDGRISHWRDYFDLGSFRTEFEKIS